MSKAVAVDSDGWCTPLEGADVLATTLDFD